MEVIDQKNRKLEKERDKSLVYIKVLQNCAIKLLKCNLNVSTILLIIDILEKEKK
ncbi:hypothetical protein [Thomasclavelia cocleata]|uniref:hypothetical protein n=1 Tax=Thomasclavelia cocleata TaxID=69824 RepID=UPI00242A6EC1|nr:hypothetical protein [Thomasclavelia cocleata]